MDKKKEKVDIFDIDFMNTSSASECTGLVQTPPLSEDEADSYTELYHVPITKADRLDAEEEQKR